MDSQQIAFVGIMAAIAVIALLAFFILLIARASVARHSSGNGVRLVYQPRWYEFVLALLVLAVVAGGLIWQVPLWERAPAPEASDSSEIAGANETEAAASDIDETNGTGSDAAAPPDRADVSPDLGDGQADGREGAFVTVMLIAAAVGFIAFVVFLFGHGLNSGRPSGVAASGTADHATVTDAVARDTVEAPSTARLLGLLAFVLLVLLVGWAYLDPIQRNDLVENLIYPAAMAVTLVLLFDKASREWVTKGAAETVREWLFCDALAVFLLLGYLNLRQWQPAEEQAYAAMFWDIVYIATLYFTFWLVDRKHTTLRFLFAYGFIVLAPVLLLIWRHAHDVSGMAATSWWETIWPCFLLTVLFFVFEIVLIIASRETPRHGVGAVKDLVFFIMYGVLLLIAIPEAAA